MSNFYTNTFQYTLTVQNIGLSPIAAGKMTVTEMLPAELNYLGVASQSGSCAFTAPAAQNGPVNLLLTNTATLAADAASNSCEIVLNVQPKADPAICQMGEIINHAQVRVEDVTSDSDQALWVTQVDCGTSLAVSKTLITVNDSDGDGLSDVVAGTEVDYLVVITNTGSAPAFAVELNDWVNAALNAGGTAQIVDMYVLENGGYNFTLCSNNGVCHFGDLAAGASKMLQVSVKINSDRFNDSLLQTVQVKADNALAVTAQVSHTIVSNARVQISKSELADPFIIAASGIPTELVEIGHYVIEVRNLGPSDARTVRVTDTLPAGLVVSATPVIDSSDAGTFGCINIGSRVLDCTVLRLPTNGVAQLVVPVAVDPALADPATLCGTTVQNTAFTVWSDDTLADGNRAVSQRISTSLVCQGDVALSKWAPATVPFSVGVNSGFVYTISVSNSGASPVAAGGLRVTDTLPAGVIFSAMVNAGSCVFSPTVNGNSVVFSNGSALAAGQSCTLTYQVRLINDPMLCVNSLLANTAEVQVMSYPFDRDAALALTTVSCRADVQVDKRVRYAGGSTSVSPGEVVSFTIDIRNVGADPAVGVKVQDIPVNFQYTLVAATTPAQYTQGAGLNFVRNAPLPVGVSEQITVVLAMEANTNQRLAVNAANSVYAQADNSPIDSATTMIAVRPVADLRITKTALTDEVRPDEKVQYHIQVKNQGPSDIRAASSYFNLFDMLEGPASLIAVSEQDCWQGVVNQPVVTAHCNDLELAAGNTLDIWVTARVNRDVMPYTSVTNTASLNNPVGFVDPNSANNQSVSVVPIVAAVPDLKASKYVKPDGQVYAGQNFTYTIFVDNLGVTKAISVTAIDTMFANGQFEVLSVSNDRGAACSPATSAGAVNNHIITCRLPVLDSNARWTITVTGTAKEQMDVNNNVRVYSQNGVDPVPDNNQANVALHVFGSADLSISKRGSAVSAPGQPISWTITVSNQGPSLAQNVQLRDLLPAGLVANAVTLLPNTLSCTAGVPGDSTRPVACNLGNLASGAAQTVVISAMVAGDAPPRAIINNAEVTADTFDGNQANNRASASTELLPVADVSISKSASHLSGHVGEVVEYTISVSNQGPAVAEDVRISDQLPFGVSWVGDSLGCGANMSNCAFGNLASGQVLTANVQVKLTDDMRCNSSVVNRATVSSRTNDPNSSNNAAQVTILGDCVADMQITKIANPSGSVDPGQPIVYRVIVENLGPSQATTVTVSDAMLTVGNFRIISTKVNLNNQWPLATCLTNGAAIHPSDVISATDRQELSCQPGATMPAGTRWEIELTVVSETSKDITNRATVRSGVLDPNQANNAASVDRSVGCIGSANSSNLSLEVNAEAQNGQRTNIGEVITFTLQYSNTGSSPVGCIRLQEFVPEGTHFLVAQSTAGWSCPDRSPAGTQCTLYIGTLGGSNVAAAEVDAGALASSGSAKFVVYVHSRPDSDGLADNDQIVDKGSISSPFQEVQANDNQSSDPVLFRAPTVQDPTAEPRKYFLPLITR